LTFGINPEEESLSLGDSPRQLLEISGEVPQTTDLRCQNHLEFNRLAPDSESSTPDIQNKQDASKNYM
jgi:hypothetical protein